MPSDPYRWCRRIFASVDLVGSTAFKARQPETSGGWAAVFKLFFDEFPTTLRACYAELPTLAEGGVPKPMRTWKFIGDEILFEAELERHEHVVYHLVAFKNALNKIAAGFLSRPKLGLALKGAVWGAGFPVTNAHVLTRFDNDRDDPPEDFVGPCVDQGFRLCALADARRVPISVDIAFMLAMTRLSLPIARHPLHVLCEEPKPHKGFGTAYPHIWIDRVDGPRSAEDQLLGRREPHDPGALLPYLRELYSANRPGLFRPFLVNDPSDDWRRIPSHMEEKRAALPTQAAEASYYAGQEPQPGVNREEPPVADLGRLTTESPRNEGEAQAESKNSA